ncbi:flagellar type III secretion system pore protein FliP [Nitriliruptor alkaliphilus]|uniref:flagellar type III secretion system pore protein FliP n=1 Tax=Nitriliruptor alkaliphilus TaxID=427918 RepID=UPI000697D262|nr:flagellar type III secretion system pore protein FliP [Nitriliruptor alkaliphilus]
MCRHAVRRAALGLLALIALLALSAAPATAQAIPTPPEGVIEVPDPDAGGPLGPTAPTAPQAPIGPEISVSVDGELAGEGLSRTVTYVLMLTVAAVAPILLLLMTTFTRFIVVLSLAKNGLGLQTVPPAQVLIGLALFLSMFSMAPTFSQVNEVAIQPMLAGEIETLEAAQAGFEPFREFMLAQTREDDLALFVGMSGGDQPADPSEIAPTTLIPAFVISELRTAFTMGFVVIVPFLVIDLVVAAVLMALGMVMLPPIFVSLPLKLLLFVLVDGWALLSRALVTSVAG